MLLNLGNLDYEIRQLIIKKLTEDSKELAGHTTKIAILEKSVESIEKGDVPDKILSQTILLHYNEFRILLHVFVFLLASIQPRC